MNVDNACCSSQRIAPFLKWPGGKRWLIPIIKRIVGHELKGTYYEPFVGAGAAFLAIAPEHAILSDINQELITCICTTIDRPTEVIRALKKYSNTETCFYKARASRPRSAIAEAARFIYLNRTCWGGIYRLNHKGQFNVPFGNSGRPILPNINFEACVKLFSRANILCADFEEVMGQAVKGDVIYADPPYTLLQKNNGFIRYNDRLFSWEDQKRLAKVCKSAANKGVFVAVSGLYHKDILGIYPGWWSLRISRKSLISGDSEKRREIFEMLLFNRKPRLSHEELLGGLQRI